MSELEIIAAILGGVSGTGGFSVVVRKVWRYFAEQSRQIIIQKNELALKSEQLEKVKDDLKAVKVQVETLLVEVAELNRLLLEQTTQRVEAEKDRDRLRHDLERTNAMLATAKSERDGLLEQKGMLAAQLQTATDKLATTKGERDQLRDALNKKTDQYIATLELTNSQQSEIKRLNERIVELEAERRELA